MSAHELRFAAMAGTLAKRVVEEMTAGPLADVSPERTRWILATAILACALEVRKQTIDEVVRVVEKSGQPWRDACAAGLRAAFPVG